MLTTLRSMKAMVALAVIALAGAARSEAADLSPASWPKNERERLEDVGSRTGGSPREAPTFASNRGEPAGSHGF